MTIQRGLKASRYLFLSDGGLRPRRVLRKTYSADFFDSVAGG